MKWFLRILVVAAIAWVIIIICAVVNVFRWDETGPLVDAKISLRHKTLIEVKATLGKPRFYWTWATRESESLPYPIGGYAPPPPLRFSKALGYLDKDQLLYIYLDEHDRVIAICLVGS